MNAGELRFDSQGLVPGIVQDADTQRVLMLGYLNRDAFRATLDTGQVHFWSRARQELWPKGATSGNTLELVAMEADCDGDALLIRARPAGPTCHRGTTSCFDAEETTPAEPLQGFALLEELWSVIADRARSRPEDSYTASLLEGGVDAVGRKVIEEAGEVVSAAKDAAGGEPQQHLAEEAADLTYHLLVLLAERGIEPKRVIEVLRRRRRNGELYRR